MTLLLASIAIVERMEIAAKKVNTCALSPGTRRVQISASVGIKEIHVFK